MDIFRFQSSAFPDSTKLVGFRGREALSELFRFEIFVTVPSEEEINEEESVWLRASLIINRGGEDHALHGMIEGIELLHEANGRALFRVDIVPHLATLKHAFRSYVWTKTSIKDILDEVLAEALGGELELRLSGNYAAEEHVCQYKETHFDFVSRWMEREGIYYFFDHSGDTDKLVLIDDPARHETRPSEPIRYYPVSASDATKKDGFRTLFCRRAARPAKVSLADYDYGKPELAVSGESDVESGLKGEVRDHGQRFFTPAEGKRLAKVRAEEQAALAHVYRGEGRVFEIRPGYRFQVDEHPISWMNAELLCVSIEHTANLAITTAELQKLTGIDIDDVYRVEVTAIVAGEPFRAARRAAWPSIHGPEVAVVDGEGSGPYAEIDADGRYNVRFLFDDNGRGGGKSSTRVRMMQPHGGNPEGFHFPLRVGTEVLVFFLGGDPDRPVIGGAVPNASTPSPVTSSNNTRNIIHTGGDTHIEIEDQAGSQWFDCEVVPKKTQLHLGKPHEDHTHYIVAKTEGDCLFEIGSNQDIHVGKNLTEHVKGEVIERYSTSQTSNVKGPQITIVDDAVEEIYGATQDTTVTGPVIEIYAAVQDTTVETVGRKENFNGSNVTIVGSDVFETYNGDVTKKVTGPTIQVMASQDIEVTGTLTQEFKSVVLENYGDVTAKMKSIEWTIKGPATVITPDWDACAVGDWWDFLQYDEYVSSKMDLLGFTLAGFGMKAEYIGVNIGFCVGKAEAVGAAISNTGVDVGIQGIKGKNEGPDFLAYAFQVIT
jgi:type VI secretion system secreted protein VgrG